MIKFTNVVRRWGCFMILGLTLSPFFSFSQTDPEIMIRSGNSELPGKGLLLSESFDDVAFPPAGWQNIQLTGTGLWARTTAGIYPPCSPHSGEGMAFYNNYIFGYDASAMLVTPALLLPAGLPKNVNFWMYRDYGWPTYADSLEVYYNSAPDLNGAVLLGKVARYYWMSDWFEFNYPIPASVSGSYYVIFRAKSGWGNDIFLDDIEIRALHVNDVGLTSVISPSAMVIAGDIIVPEVMVRNYGIEAQSDVPVRYKNGQTGEVLTQMVPFLDTAAVVNVAFPAWTASTGGPYDFIFYTDLPGDEVSANDTLSKMIICTESNQSYSHSVSGGLYHSLHICSDGTVMAWGRNSDGQLGDGTNTDSNIPVEVANLTDIIRVAAGKFHSIALKSDGTAWSFGKNGSGQLGNGSTVNSNIPVQVSGLTNITDITGGDDHTLAIRSDGTVWAWGGNSWGQLGDGTTNDSETPVQVTGISSATAITAGEGFSMALMNDGTVMAWGANQSGQLGNGTIFGSNVPVLVSNLSDVIDIAAGTIHSIALKNDGTVWAWGYNFLGQLGNGTNTDSDVPVQVTGLNSITTISAGGASTYAVKYDGTAWAWGWNSNGQLGNGSTINSNLPIEISGLTDMIAIAGGAFHCLSINQEGELFTWGANDYGQLGNGANTESHVPVLITGICPVYTPDSEIESAKKDKFSLYPNPSDGHFIIQTHPGPGTVNDGLIEIFNAFGNKILSTGFSPGNLTSVNLSDWGKGVYVVSVKIQNDTHFKKIIIH